MSYYYLYECKDFGCRWKDVPQMVSRESIKCLRCESENVECLTEKSSKLGWWIYLIISTVSSIVVGGIDIVVTATDLGGIDRVEFYVDGELKANISSEPYVWIWDESLLFGRRTIKVIAYDTIGSSASDDIKVWKFF